MTTRKQRASDAGVTLLELLVVLIIVGLLAAVSIPSFVKARNNSGDKSIQADLKSVASAVETWTTDNPGDMDGPAAWNAPLTNLQSSGAIRPYIELEPFDLETYKVALDFGNYVKIYTNSQTASYCLVGASKKSSRGWNEATHPIVANVFYYNPEDGKVSTTAPAGCAYAVGNSPQRTEVVAPVETDPPIPVLPDGTKCHTFTQANGAAGFENLSWAAASGATSYIIKSYRNAVLADTDSVTATSFAATETAGYTWQYTVDARGPGFANTPCAAPAAPPEGHQCITFTQTAGAVGYENLSWAAASGANGYRIKSYRNAVLVDTDTITATSFAATETAGYTWQYTVEAKGIGFPNSLCPQPAAPPEGHQCITFTQAPGAPNQVTLSWSAVAGANGYRVKSYMNGVLRWTDNLGPGTSMTGDATAGYTWQYTVEAKGIGFPNSLCPQPALPPEGYRCTTYTKTAGAVGYENLSWTAVTGANAYRIKGYRNGVLVSTDTITGTAWTASDPAPDFWDWTVEARGVGFANTLCPVPAQPAPACPTNYNFGGASWQPTTATWTNPAFSTGSNVYLVSSNGSSTLLGTTAGSSITLPAHVRDGRYTGVKVIPYNASGSATGCLTLSILTYILPCPSTYENGTTLSWYPIPGADSYSRVSRAYTVFPPADGAPTSLGSALSTTMSTTKFEYRIYGVSSRYSADQSCGYDRYGDQSGGGGGGTR